jgi:hypothetical protein
VIVRLSASIKEIVLQMPLIVYGDMIIEGPPGHLR